MDFFGQKKVKSSGANQNILQISSNFGKFQGPNKKDCI